MNTKSRKNHRRRNGEGSICKRKDGRFQASIMINGGKRVYFYSYQKKECLDWLTMMRDKIRKKISISGGRIPFIDYANQYIEVFCKPFVRPNTLSNYECYANKHLPKYDIAYLSIEDITVEDGQRFFNQLANENSKLDGSGTLSTKTQHSIHQFLKAVMGQAMVSGYVSRNIFETVRIPKIRSEKRTFLTDSDVAAIIKAASNHSYAVGLKILSKIGLRLSELLALRHSSIVKVDGIKCFYISQCLKREPNTNAKEGDPRTILHLAEPKTESSKDYVPIPPELLSELEQHISKQNELVKLGVYQENPFIICSYNGGYIDPSTFRSFMRKTVEKAGLPITITPHCLRHYTASNLIRNGVSVTAASKILRHAQTSITLNIYCDESLQGEYEALLLTENADKISAIH